MRIISFCLLLGCASVSMGDTSIYQSKDAKGVAQFSDQVPNTNTGVSVVTVPGMSKQDEETAKKKLEELRKEDQQFDKQYEKATKDRQALQLKALNSYTQLKQAEAEYKEANDAAIAATNAIPPVLYDATGNMVYNPEREAAIQKSDFLQKVAQEAKQRVSAAQQQYDQDRTAQTHYRPDYN